LDRTRRWLDGGTPAVPRDLVVLGDPRYPALLLQTADPPLLLHVHGRAELLSAPSIAIVGSRHPTPQGLDNARSFARHLGDHGLAVVSGLARGIDGAAHEGALASAAGTLAFVGSGLDQPYPPDHAELAARIAEHGLVASEHAPGTSPRPENFPRRNRLIAGVSRGTLVVEAALRSGSLITARMAVEAGREVFAIPGSIHSPQSRGCHRLIQQGAKLVETGDDILQELRLAEPVLARPEPTPSTAGPAIPPGTDASLMAALGHDPGTFDALAARTGLPADRLSAQLLELELAGCVRRLPGGLLQRVGTA
ncbi:MAG TPA: DNA-processing protein DprA, partial [Burkholderiaceae bacterium]